MLPENGSCSWCQSSSSSEPCCQSSSWYQTSRHVPWHCIPHHVVWRCKFLRLDFTHLLTCLPWINPFLKSCFQGIDGLPEEVTGLLALAQNVPPVARSALMYGLFALGGILLILAVGCLVRSSGRQETLNLEGTQHYAKPTEKNGKSHSNGKSLETRTNPAFEQ